MSESTPAKASSTGRALLVASTIMALGTLISKVLGLGRNMLQAAALGTDTQQGDILSTALTVPNQLYFLLAGGTLNAVLVPLIVRAIKNDADGGAAYINRLLTIFITLLAGATILCLLFTPQLLVLFADNRWRAPELAAQWQSMIWLTMLTLPQIFFFGMFFIAGQILNARDRFGPMMWAPIANNVVTIATFIFYMAMFGTRGNGNQPFTSAETWTLGIGTTLGIIVQAAVMLPYLRAVGIKFRPRFDLRGVGLGHTFHVAKWVLAQVVVLQIAMTLTNRILTGATTHGDGGAGMVAYQNAMLVWGLPHGMITVSITTALVPAISRLAAGGDMRAVGRETMRGLKLSSTLMVPIAVGLAVLAWPVATLAFGWGKGASGVDAIAWSLALFSIGLPAYTAVYVLMRTFFALEDTKTSLKIVIVNEGAYVVLAYALALPFYDPAQVAPRIALAYTLANVPAMLYTYVALRRDVPGVTLSETVRHWVRLIVATIPAAALAWGIMWFAGRLNPSRLLMFAALVVAAIVAVVVFYLCARLLHIDEVRDTVAMVLRRGRRGPDDEQPSEPALSPEEHTIISSEFANAETVLMPPVLPRRAAEADVVSVPDVPGDNEGYAAIDDGQDLDDEEVIDTSAALGPIADVDRGDILGERYELTDYVIRRGSTVTWKAFDSVLSRTVLIHILQPADARTPQLLAAARHAAVATDSRFLRVLDAVHAEDPKQGSYIVCEYVPGMSLSRLLAQGPLSGLEAGWLTRELADALAAVHAQGLYHGRLSPDTVVISETGNVKIVGFMINAALHPLPGDDERSEADWEAADVEALGKICYASLVRRWCGGTRYGLDAAPRNSTGGWLTPRQVRAGISPALDQICDQILSRPPRGGLLPLRTATDVMLALARVLGSADGAHDLERRLRSPMSPPSARSAVSAATPGAPRSSVSAPSEVGDEAPFTPVPAPRRAVPTPTTTPRPREPRRQGMFFLIGLIVIALALGIFATVNRLQGGSATSRATGQATTTVATTAAPTPRAWPLRNAIDFDPEGSQSENADQVGMAIDGNPDTAWHTEIYPNPTFSGRKAGVGLIVDLGEVRQIRRVDLHLIGAPTALQVRVPADAGLTQPPMGAVSAWTVVGQADQAGTDVQISPGTVATARFVLVWITTLPSLGSGQGFQAAIREIEVWG